MGGLKHRTNLGNIRVSGGKFYGKTRHEGKAYVYGGFQGFGSTFAKGIVAISKQDGSLDSSFNLGLGFDSGVTARAVQSDGKIVVAGAFTSYNGTTANRIVRLNTDGSIDTSFNAGSGFNNAPTSMALQSDGKIVVVGAFTSYNGTTANRIVRLNTDGSIDTSFNTGSGFNTTVSSTVVQSDGKILLGGQWTITSYNGTSIKNILRLNSNGNIDTSFNVGSGFSNYSSVYNLYLSPSDSKIFVLGYFNTWQGASSKGLVRLNANGSRDTSFNVGSGFSFVTYALDFQSDGKIVVVGFFTSYNGTTANNIVRLNSNGSFDTSFSMGTGLSGVGREIFIQDDDTITVVGSFSSYNGTNANQILRLNANGTIDTSFTPQPENNSNFQKPVFPLSKENQMILFGSFNTYGYANYSPNLTRLNFNGSVDSSFDFDINTYIYRAAIQSDGKIVVLIYSDSNYTYDFIRINLDGSVDTSFNLPVSFSMPSTTSNITIQSDDKIIFSPSITLDVYRLNTDGSIDSSFDTGTGFAGGNYFGEMYGSTALQSDGKIIVVGMFNSYNGTSINGVVRLNTDGSIDSSFDPGSGIDYDPFFSNSYLVIIQPDGKILISGMLTSYNGTAVNGMVRVNTDGSIDTSFNTGSGFNNAPTSMAVQSDGKIIAVGGFTSYNGTTANRIVRLNTDGSIDTSFNTGSGFNSTVSSTVVQSDGKIIAVGAFTMYNENISLYITKLNIDGSVVTDLPETFNKVNPNGNIQLLVLE